MTGTSNLDLRQLKPSRQSDAPIYLQLYRRFREAIAAGKGALATVNAGDAGSGTIDDAGDIGPNEAVVEAPERMFTRKRLGSI